MATPAEAVHPPLVRRPGALRDRLRVPVDGASIAAFRIGFGVVGMAVVVRLLAYGWWERLWLDPLYLLPYPGFEWLPRPDRAGLAVLLALIAGSAGAVAVVGGAGVSAGARAGAARATASTGCGFTAGGVSEMAGRNCCRVPTSLRTASRTLDSLVRQR